MGISKENIVTNGLSGKTGEYVFRQLNGKTVVSKMPVFLKPPTVEQWKKRSAFKDAVAYAKTALMDADIKTKYKVKAKPGQSAFNRAIIDFLTLPVIEEIDCTNYHAQPGCYITITASDDFRVASVHVKIENTSGAILEESAAVLLDGQLKWIYRPVVPVQEITGNTITVTVIDLPGNAVTGQKTMN